MRSSVLSFSLFFLKFLSYLSLAKWGSVGYAAEWDEFEHQMSAIAKRVMYATCIGNHERDYPHFGSSEDGVDSHGECGVPYPFPSLSPHPLSLSFFLGTSTVIRCLVQKWTNLGTR